METGYERAVASLAVVGDGTVSLYFSNGGGVIGAGEHAPVREAGLRMLDVVEGVLDGLETTDVLPLPGLGEVRFNVLTFESRRTAAARESDLGDGRHALSALFYAGHDVIAAIRQATAPS